MDAQIISAEDIVTSLAEVSLVHEMCRARPAPRLQHTRSWAHSERAPEAMELRRCRSEPGLPLPAFRWAEILVKRCEKVQTSIENGSTWSCFHAFFLHAFAFDFTE